MIGIGRVLVSGRGYGDCSRAINADIAEWLASD
jgi:hypothetical protein